MLETVEYRNRRLESSKEDLDRFQNQCLRWTVKYAFENAPFYHEAFRKANLCPEDIKTYEDLKKLPIINKRVLKENQNLETGEFRLSAAPIENSIPYLTSGTTGTPAIILKTDEELHALNSGPSACALNAMNIRKGDRVLNYLPFVEIPIKIGKKQYFGKNISGTAARHTLNLMGCSEVEPSDINEKCAKSAFGLSTQIDRVGAKWLGEGKNPKKLGLESLMVSGEPTSLSKKKYIANTFDTEVYDTHGSTEFVIGFFDCKYHNGMHANYHILSEVINPETGEELSENEEGHIVMTGLLPPGVKGGTILLRYDIEDITKKLANECECGRVLDVFNYTRRSSNKFIVGGVKFSAEEFEQMLYEFSYFKCTKPEHQIIVDFDERPEVRQDVLTVNIERKNLNELPEDIDTLLQNYVLERHPFLNDTVSRDVARFEVKFVDEFEIPRGKPKRLIDRRSKI
jgi:phenylacetate-coenzyme A ligase PaaK-like adenylate-forming protein